MVYERLARSIRAKPIRRGPLMVDHPLDPGVTVRPEVSFKPERVLAPLGEAHLLEGVSDHVLEAGAKLQAR